MDVPPRPPDEMRRDDHDTERATGDSVDEREERAVDAATAERLSRGVRRDTHGEYAPDPYPDEADPGASTEDVIEHHRREAERIEHQPDVPRADD